MATWTWEEPGAGDTAALRTLAVNLDYLVLPMLAEGRARVMAESATIGQAWSSTAGSEWTARASALAQKMLDVFGPAVGYGGALTQYAGAVEDIAVRARAARENLSTAEADYKNAMSRMLTAQSTSSGARRPLGPYRYAHDPTTPAYWASAMDEADERATAARRALDTLSEERATADAILLGALTPIVSPDWGQVGQLMSDAGLTRPDHHRRCRLDAARPDQDAAVPPRAGHRRPARRPGRAAHRLAR